MSRIARRLFLKNLRLGIAAGTHVNDLVREAVKKSKGLSGSIGAVTAFSTALTALDAVEIYNSGVPKRPTYLRRSLDPMTLKLRDHRPFHEEVPTGEWICVVGIFDRDALRILINGVERIHEHVFCSVKTPLSISYWHNIAA